MKNNKTLKISFAALFAALIFLGTMYLRIPISFSGEGYINLGDCFIIIAALLLGPVYGGLAGAIGAALADALSGFAIYIPATFIIKFIMAVTAFFAYKGFKRLLEKHIILPTVIAATAAELIMAAGYLIYEIIIYGSAAAIAGIPGNSIQAAGSIIIGTIIFNILYRAKAVERFENELKK